MPAASRPENRLRVASFNVENLFARPRVFNKDAVADSGQALKAAAQLQRLLAQKLYDRQAILDLFNGSKLYEMLEVRCDRVTNPASRSNKFFFHAGNDDRTEATSINDAVRGRDDWQGAMSFRAEPLDGAQVQAIAKVIKKIDADVIALCEVEDRRTLEDFNARHLARRYPYAVLVEGNDERGIDIAVLSRVPVVSLRTNVFTIDPAERPRRDGRTPRLFNRDCLEVTLDLGAKGPLSLLAAHLKSKLGSAEAESASDPKRLAQAAEIARIVAARHAKGGRPHRVIVAGDLNEQPDRDGRNGAMLRGAKTSIDPLFACGLSNVVREALGEGSWTYVKDAGGRQERSQIDYLLLSPDLRAAAMAAGVDRSGQPGWGPKAPPRGLAASDHAAVWVDLDLGKL
jgi:endonuclease/exonuclease/phosphatase family metal-dependent hydrolase